MKILKLRIQTHLTQSKRGNIMKKLLIVLSLCVFVIGCDEMQKPAMDVVGDILAPTEEPTTQVAPPSEISEIPENTERVIPLTLDHLPHLEPGLYRLRPNGYNTRSLLGERVISEIYWGNITSLGQPVEREYYPPDATKVSLGIVLLESPYELTLDGQTVINLDENLLLDEVVIRIHSHRVTGERIAGERGNSFRYDHVIYAGTLIENITNPDIVFEYE